MVIAIAVCTGGCTAIGTADVADPPEDIAITAGTVVEDTITAGCINTFYGIDVDDSVCAILAVSGES
jgi:stage V sporulation protein SpoVS